MQKNHRETTDNMCLKHLLNGVSVAALTLGVTVLPSLAWGSNNAHDAAREPMEGDIQGGARPRFAADSDSDDAASPGEMVRGPLNQNKKLVNSMQQIVIEARARQLLPLSSGRLIQIPDTKEWVREAMSDTRTIRDGDDIYEVSIKCLKRLDPKPTASRWEHDNQKTMSTEIYSLFVEKDGIRRPVPNSEVSHPHYFEPLGENLPRPIGEFRRGDDGLPAKQDYVESAKYRRGDGSVVDVDGRRVELDLQYAHVKMEHDTDNRQSYQVVKLFSVWRQGDSVTEIVRSDAYKITNRSYPHRRVLPKLKGPENGVMDSILDEVAGPKGTKISKEIVQREEYSRNGWRFEDSQLMGYERYVLTTTGEELESLGTPYTPQSKSLEKITDECTAAGIPTRATCRVIQEYTRPDNTPYSHRLAPVKVALIPTHLTFIHEEDEETSYQQARFHCMYEGTSYPIIDAHTLRGVPFKHKIKDLGWDDDLVHHRSIHTERIFIDKAGALNLGGIPVQDLIVNKGKKTEQVHEHISKVWEALPGMNYKILHSKKEYR